LNPYTRFLNGRCPSGPSAAFIFVKDLNPVGACCPPNNQIKLEITMRFTYFRKASRLTFFVFLFAGMTQFVQAQVNVKGTVTDAADKSSLVAVSILEVGPGTVTQTDANGNFTISVNDLQASLRFSYLGYVTKTIKLNGLNRIDVSLEPAQQELNQVIVVGYGAQKKVNLTGSVQTLKLDSAVNVPVTNAAQLMYGRFSGVQLTQGGGLAGSDGSSINIRGLGTFGNANPLIVIDGMQFDGMSEFNRLTPSDIESVTVLKDASAGAIYGARGANGVIIVTTKQGQAGVSRIEYNNFVGTQRPTVIPEFLLAVDYAVLINERYKNMADGKPYNPRYTDVQLQQIMDGSNPDQFAQTDWADQTLRDAPLQNHYLSLSGGSQNTTYRLSLGYLGQGAVVVGKFRSSRYNFRANMDSKVNKRLTINNNFNGTYNKFSGPADGADIVSDIMYSLQRNAPTIPAYYSNGAYGFVDGAYENVNFSYATGSQPLQRGQFGDFKSHDYNINDRINVKADIFKGLSVESAVTLNLDFVDESNFTPTFARRDYEGELISSNVNNTLTNRFDKHYRILNENLLRYHLSLQETHDFDFLAGHSIVYDNTDNFRGSLSNFPSDNLQEFDGGGVSNPAVAGGGSEQSLQSFFFRMNYSFRGRYLLEGNIRRDGSSKFGPGNRYGNFPSFSAGWRISEEPFLKRLLSTNTLSELKLRGSWGRTGNNGIGNYIYDQTYNAGLDYVLGDGTIVSGVALTSLANPYIRWETTEQYNIGLDAGLFNNRLTLEANYFSRKSYDILYTNFPIPGTLGVNSLAAQNSAKMLNKGMELNVNYGNKNKDFNYNVGFNVTKFAKNKVTDLGTGVQTIDGSTVIRVGDPFKSYFGYKVEGIFQTAEEVAAAPTQFGSLRTAPGDLRYADLGGPDGVPDGIIDGNDRVVIGNPYPLWLYGMNVNLSYKGIDLAILAQGIAEVDRLMTGNGQLPFNDDRSNALTYWTNRWTPENPSTKLPRLGGSNNAEVSSFYVEDASYLRIKNIELGYSLPKSLTNSIGINKVRLFVSGQNLVTFTRMKNFDPERSAGNVGARNAPLYKVFTGGLNFTF
jgi:TonB-linked SusC/RagA family outer membrane protein